MRTAVRSLGTVASALSTVVLSDCRRRPSTPRAVLPGITVARVAVHCKRASVLYSPLVAVDPVYLVIVKKMHRSMDHHGMHFVEDFVPT